jgi:hypothetical protein
MPEHEMTRRFAQRDEITFGEFEFWRDAHRKNMVHG